MRAPGGEGPDQADLVLARLQIAHRKNKRRPDSEAVAHRGCGGSRAIGRNSDAAAFGTTTTLSSSRVAVYLQNGFPRKLRPGEDFGRSRSPSAARSIASCLARVAGEIFGVLQEADVVHAHYHRQSGNRPARCIARAADPAGPAGLSSRQVATQPRTYGLAAMRRAANSGTESTHPRRPKRHRRRIRSPGPWRQMRSGDSERKPHSP